MATDKQLRADRENAKKSTGPKTVAGRLKSSRNALRHGLSLPITMNAERWAEAARIAQTLVSDQADGAQVMVATEVAHAQSDLLRIYAARKQLIKELDLGSGDLAPLRRLAALDRYECAALSRRLRASAKLRMLDSTRGLDLGR